MRRLLTRILAGLAALVLLAVTAVAAVAQLRWDRTFDAPAPALRASTDSAVIARGRALVFGPAKCAACHTPGSQGPRIEAGEELPLVGGHEWALPVGTVRSPNLTPDPETGIGRRSDAELARMLRHGVRADGRAAIPFMEFQGMSDEDLVAVLSYLRSRPPVRNAVPEHELNLAGRAVMALLIEPRSAPTPPPVQSPAEAATIERGAYLANEVAECASCHSQRSPVDGSYVGPRFAGGGEMPLEHKPGWVAVAPNLTPHPTTGHITAWSEDQFVARFRTGKVGADSFMPWWAFQRMSDADLRAIYRYLRTLPPVENATGPLLRPQA